MRHLLLTALAALSAGPALALSCMPPDPVALYERARDAEESFLIIRGRILADGKVALPSDGKDAETSVRIEGLALTSEGFGTAFEREAILRLTCAGPWCPNAPEDGEALIAVELEGSALVVEQGPCYANILPATDEGAERIMACHRGEACVKKGF